MDDGAVIRPRIHPDLGGFLAQLGAHPGVSISRDPEDIARMSSDFSERRLAEAGAVVAVASVGDIQAVVAAARASGIALHPRGGGMSYTLGYAPRDPDGVVLDCRGLKRFDLDPAAMTLTVGAGVTWAEIANRLAGTGHSLAYRGTVSGSVATVGGGVANFANGNGPGDIGTDLIGLQVVTGEGRVIETGARALRPDAPGIRHSAPDLTGLFINACGAFGIVAAATFRLRRDPPVTRCAAFVFPDEISAALALADVTRLDLGGTSFIFTRLHHRAFATMPKPGREEQKALARAVAARAGGPVHAAARLAGMARSAHLRFLVDAAASLTATFDTDTRAEAAWRCARATKAAIARGGRPVPAVLGYALRAQPFPPIGAIIIGPDGECSIPTNACVPLGEAEPFVRAVHRFFDGRAEAMQAAGVFHTVIHIGHGSLFGTEPVIYWRDRMSPLRASVVLPEKRAAQMSIAENRPGRDFALALRRDFIDAVCTPHRAAHVQLGKYYPFAAKLADDATWPALQAIRRALDPDGVINPGAIGLS